MSKGRPLGIIMEAEVTGMLLNDLEIGDFHKPPIGNFPTFLLLLWLVVVASFLH